MSYKDESKSNKPPITKDKSNNIKSGANKDKNDSYETYEKEKKNISGDENINSNDELMKQLAVLNLSIETLEVIILAVFLNINFLKWQKEKLLDDINGTDFSKESPNLSGTPKLTNLMFIYTSSVFLGINYNAYKDIALVTGKKRNQVAIKKAWRSFLSSILNLISLIIGVDNLDG